MIDLRFLSTMRCWKCGKIELAQRYTFTHTVVFYMQTNTFKYGDQIVVYAKISTCHFASTILAPLQGVPVGDVQSIQPTASDHHCGGQSVLLLRFHHGAQVLYKPFGGEPSLLIAQLFQTLNAQPTLQGANSIPFVNVLVPEQVCSCFVKFRTVELLCIFSTANNKCTLYFACANDAIKAEHSVCIRYDV